MIEEIIKRDLIFHPKNETNTVCSTEGTCNMLNTFIRIDYFIGGVEGS